MQNWTIKGPLQGLVGPPRARGPRHLPIFGSSPAIHARCKNLLLVSFGSVVPAILITVFNVGIAVDIRKRDKARKSTSS